MKLEKNRHMVILDTLIHADKAVTAEQLAKVSRSSVRTVKNDIVYLNSVLQREKSAAIISLKAKGYEIRALEKDRYDGLVNDIAVARSLFYNRSIERVNRRIYILQRSLIDDYFRAEAIAEELYLTRSSLSRDFAWAARFLESYHLDLCSEQKHGYYLKGKEQDLRSALVELHCSQYHEFQLLYPYKPFNRAFTFEGEDHYPEIRRAFLNVLRNSKITISDIATKKIATHICLMKNRINQGKHVVLESDMAQTLADTYDYQIACRIFRDPVISNYIVPSEMEVLNFARLLLINRDINMRTDGISSLPLPLVIENTKVLQSVINEMDRTIGSGIHKTDFFKVYVPDFESLQMQIYLKYCFDYTSKVRMITYTEADENMLSPVPMELTRNMIYLLQKKLGVKIRDSVVMAYAAVYERMLKRVKYPYKKKRLAVTSNEGLVYSQHIAELLKESFGIFIENVKAYNIYELRKVDFSELDAVVHCGPILYYSYPVPAVTFHELDYEKYFDESLFRNLFLSGYGRQKIDELNVMLQIHQNTRISDPVSFIEAVSYKYGKDDVSQQRIVEYYNESDVILSHYLSRNGILLYLIPYEFTEREFFDIYLPAETVYFEQSVELKTVITASFDPEMKLADLKVLDHVLRYIIQVTGTVEEMIDNKEEVLDRINDRIARHNFFAI